MTHNAAASGNEAIDATVAGQAPPAASFPAQSAHETWVAKFVRLHGRPPRVLHFGNIANNAYVNANLLRQEGISCDVLCRDYYHLMGCPEWEDAELEGVVEDQFRPDWTRVSLQGFKRPRWFAQGPLQVASLYLIARNDGRRGMAWFLWHVLAAHSKTPHLGNAHWSGAEWLAGRFWQLVGFALRVIFFVSRAGEGCAHRRCKPEPESSAAQRVIFWFRFIVLRLGALVLLPIWLLVYAVERGFTQMAVDGRPVWNLCWLGNWVQATLRGLLAVMTRTQRDPVWIGIRARHQQLTAEFARSFPDRPDQLTEADIEPYLVSLPLVSLLLRRYDIVQAYATEPIWAMLAGFHPYVAYEHGTLRTFTLDENSTCRLTALAYRLADRVLITNGDCLAYAQKLGIGNYLPMLHPIREDSIRSAPSRYDELHSELGVRYVFLCTLRHDWDVKGTDKYIRAMPKIRARIGDDFRVIMTEWGRQVEESRALAVALGVDRWIQWRQPLSRKELFSMLRSVDVLLDQTVLPHFGATAPEGIAAGAPVIMSYDSASTAWIVPEPAPILTASTPDEIADAVATAINPQWRDDYQRRARDWINRCHSSRHVVQTHLKVYGEALGFGPLLSPSGDVSQVSEIRSPRLS